MKEFCLIGLVGLTGLTACAHTKAPPAPKWVQRGSGAFADEAPRFLGVGSVAKIKNVKLAQQAAENRARNELAKVFETFMASITHRDVDRFTEPSPEEQAAERALYEGLKKLSQSSIDRTRIIDTWLAPDGTRYALAALELQDVLEVVQTLDMMDAKARGFLERGLKRSFEPFQAESDY